MGCIWQNYEIDWDKAIRYIGQKLHDILGKNYRLYYYEIYWVKAVGLIEQKIWDSIRQRLCYILVKSYGIY